VVSQLVLGGSTGNASPTCYVRARGPVVNPALAAIAEQLDSIARQLRPVYARLEFGHDDRVLLREVHDGVTRFAQQLEELSRRTSSS
jgi:hypothetical protein